MKQKINTLLLSWLIVSFSAQAGIFDGIKGKKPEQPLPKVKASVDYDELKKLEAAVESIKKIQHKLAARSANKFGFEIYDVGSKEEILNGFNEIQKIINDPKYAKLAQTDLKQEALIQVILMLFKGRGENDAGSGWYLMAKKPNQNSLNELNQLIDLAVLDQSGKKQIIQELEAIEYTDVNFKKQQGFPPDFIINSDAIVQNIIKRVKQTPTASDYLKASEVLGNNTPLKLADLIKDKVSDSKLREVLTKFVGSVEKNFYDSSIDEVHLSTKPLIPIYGRDQEARLMIDTLARVEKGHVLLTGQAGIGKTTLVKKVARGFFTKEFSIRDEEPPVVLELSIVDVTNQVDPTSIKEKISLAQLLSEAIKRRVILYVDEAHVSSKIVRNAVKSFLSDKILNDGPQVNLIFSTTSSEARDFLSDSAFSRRFDETFIREFNKQETFELIEKSYLPLWKEQHQTDVIYFDGITAEALNYAYDYADVEQPHAGNPTGVKELLEGAITRKLRLKKELNHLGAFVIDVADIREYMRDKLQIKLVPGDEKFDATFEAMWAEFESEYIGNEGFKAEMKSRLKKFFSNPKKEKMEAWVFFGPPGAGKTYGANLIAKHFFKGSVLSINGAEHSNGGLEGNKLIGSPPGTVGSEEQRSVLTQFMANHKEGLIVIEEADYVHQDVIRIFTNMITDKKFTDGLGKEWKTGRYILVLNSNIGQQLMIADGGKDKMSWPIYQSRRAQVVEKVVVAGKTVERVQTERVNAVFEQFIQAIVTKSNPGSDTSAADQEYAKQVRRYKPFYILSPTPEELKTVADLKVKKFIDRAANEYEVKFVIEPALIDKISQIDQYDFKSGFSFVGDKLELGLFAVLESYYHEKQKTIHVVLSKDKNSIMVRVENQDPEFYSLEKIISKQKNPWNTNPEMIKRIENLPLAMRKNLRGHSKAIIETKSRLQLKLQNWNLTNVITLLGTTGNGKTRFFEVLAEALFGSKEALLVIPNIHNKYQLGDYFRPPVGIQGGKDVTEFEKRFKNLRAAGGGIILFDELLSLEGLNSVQVSEKNEVINELYPLFDKGVLKIAGKEEDARGFVIGITGNLFQALFNGIPDDPGSDRLVEEVESKIDDSVKTEYFRSFHIDPAKVARFGAIYVKGPLPRVESIHGGAIAIAESVQQMKAELDREFDFIYDPKINELIIDKVTTRALGMRNAKSGGLDKVILKPLGQILRDFANAKKIELKVDQADQVSWWADGKRLVLDSYPLDDSGLIESKWVERSGLVAIMGDDFKDQTPQLKELESPNKINFSDLSAKMIAIHEVYGHWMTGVCLDGKNNTQTISLIPGVGYAGYVRHKQKKDDVSLDSLSSMLKSMITLQAGHRAVFLLSSVYATGGGPSRSAEANSKNLDDRGDDIGKVEALIERILANQLLDFHDASKAKQLKVVLKEISAYAADKVISLGSKSKRFEPLFNEVIAKKFVDEKRLDDFVLQSASTALTDQGDYVLLQSMVYAVDRYKQKHHQQKLEHIIEDMMIRLTEEVVARNQNNAALVKAVHELVGSNICEKLFSNKLEF